MNASQTGFRTVFSTPFFEIEENPESSLFDGRPYYRMTGKDSAICCLIGEGGNIVMVRQFRPNLGFHTLEFPAGAVESGESPVEAVRREIAEETGFYCTLLELGTFNVMMNRTNTRDHIFFGMDPVPVPNHTPEVGIEIIEISREKLVTLTQNGGYLQIIGLGVLQLISISLGVDVMRDPVEHIHERFRAEILVRKN